MHRALMVVCAGLSGCQWSQQEVLRAEDAYARSASARVDPFDRALARVLLDEAGAARLWPNPEQARTLAYVAEGILARPRTADRPSVEVAVGTFESPAAEFQAPAAPARKQRVHAPPSQRVETAPTPLTAESEPLRALPPFAHLDERGIVVTLPTALLFAPGQADLLPAGRARLAQVSEALQTLGERTVLIECHTDALGSDYVNRELSTQRAQAVRAALIEQGLPAPRVRAEGVGGARPIASNTTDEGRLANRRIEIIVAGIAALGWN